MIYLSGTWSRALASCSTGADPIGCIVTPSHRTPEQYITRVPRGWGADNGCFKHPERFHLPSYLEWLKGLQWHAMTCFFATAPDVVGDAAETWRRSAPAFEPIRALGFPAALVAQDGFDPSAVDWDAFDTLFIGGSTEWKERHAREAAYHAHKHGKWVHMGRVNSFRRLLIAQNLGCSSVDGTYLKHAPCANLARLREMLKRCNSRQRDLYSLKMPTEKGKWTLTPDGWVKGARA